MINAAEIDKTIAAHGLWKSRLKSAISSGSSEFTVEHIRGSHLCEFGKWLMSLTPPERAAEPCRSIILLHGKFHIEAAYVLDLALKGSVEEAKAQLGGTSPFMMASAALTKAMIKWKASLG